eukprot:15009971-Alexandrium_andersonii.AAC.1
MGRQSHCPRAQAPPTSQEPPLKALPRQRPEHRQRVLPVRNGVLEARLPQAARRGRDRKSGAMAEALRRGRCSPWPSRSEPSPR